MLTAADRLGVAFGELSRRVDWLDASALVSQSLLRSSSSLMVLVQEIADHVLRLSRACTVTVVVSAPDDPTLLEVRIAAGERAAELIGSTVPKRWSVAGSAMSRDQGRFATTTHLYSSAVPTGSAPTSRPVMAVPIRSAGGQALGAIEVQRRPGQPSFDATDLSMAEDFARQTSLALELNASRTSQDPQQASGESEDFTQRLYDDLLQRLFSIGMTVQRAEADLRQGTDSSSVRRAETHLARAVDDLNATIRDVRGSLQSRRSGRLAAAPAATSVPVASREAGSADLWLDQQASIAASLVQAAAVDAAKVAQVAVVTAADRAAEAASTARAQRSAAVARAARTVAARVSEAAAAVESEADLAALTVAQAAFDAALLIASSVAPGSERDAALTATLVATAVSAVAIKTAAVTAAARAEVARNAALAAAAAASAAADAEKILDLEVAYAAEAVQAVARGAARVLAERADDEAAAFAVALH